MVTVENLFFRAFEKTEFSKIGEKSPIVPTKGEIDFRGLAKPKTPNFDGYKALRQKIQSHPTLFTPERGAAKNGLF